jgi:hypothetical protein
MIRQFYIDNPAVSQAARVRVAACILLAFTFLSTASFAPNFASDLKLQLKGPASVVRKSISYDSVRIQGTRSGYGGSAILNCPPCP